MGGAQAEARSDNGLAAEVIEQVRRYECGEDVTWDDQLPPGRVVALPAYPWRHARYWIETKPGATRYGAARGLSRRTPPLAAGLNPAGGALGGR